jgi:hypothetical protein
VAGLNYWVVLYVGLGRKIEDTKELIRICKSKDIQHNGHEKGLTTIYKTLPRKQKIQQLSQNLYLQEFKQTRQGTRLPAFCKILWFLCNG